MVRPQNTAKDFGDYIILFIRAGGKSMLVHEFGDTSKQKIILIHGFQSPWQVWEKYIEHYKKDFHVIVPIISGHNPEDKPQII